MSKTLSSVLLIALLVILALAFFKVIVGMIGFILKFAVPILIIVLILYLLKKR